MKKLFCTLLLLLVPALALAAPWDPPQYLLAGPDPQFIFKKIDYQIPNIDGSAYTWESSNPHIVSVTENGIITGLKNGESTITGSSKKDDSVVELNIILPAFVYSEDLLTLDDPNGKDFYIQMIDPRSHFQGARTKSDAFSIEVIEHESIPGMYTVHLSPLKAGEGILYYTVSNTAYSIAVTVSESALSSGSKTRILSLQEQFPQFSSGKNKAIPYDYDRALNHPNDYAGTNVMIEGTVLYCSDLKDSNNFSFFCVDNNLDQIIVFSIPDGELPPQGLQTLDRLTITGKANGIYENKGAVLPLIHMDQMDCHGPSENLKDLYDIFTLVFKANSLAASSSYLEPESISVPEKSLPFDYLDIARYPEKYEGQTYTMHGFVEQVMGSRKDGYSIRFHPAGEKNSVILYLSVTPSHTPDFNILQDDSLEITFTMHGDYTYESVRGDEITLPYALVHSVQLYEYQ